MEKPARSCSRLKYASPQSSKRNKKDRPRYRKSSLFLRRIGATCSQHWSRFLSEFRAIVGRANRVSSMATYERPGHSASNDCDGFPVRD